MVLCQTHKIVFNEAILKGGNYHILDWMLFL